MIDLLNKISIYLIELHFLFFFLHYLSKKKKFFFNSQKNGEIKYVEIKKVCHFDYLLLVKREEKVREVKKKKKEKGEG